MLSVGLQPTMDTNLSSVEQGLLLLPSGNPWRKAQPLHPPWAQLSTTDINTQLLLLGLKNQMKLFELLLARRI